MKKKYFPWLLITSLLVAAVSLNGTTATPAATSNDVISCSTDTIPRDSSRRYQRSDTSKRKMPTQRPKKDSTNRKRDTSSVRGR